MGRKGSSMGRLATYAAVRLEPQTMREIEKLAARERRTVSAMHRMLLEESLAARRKERRTDKRKVAEAGRPGEM